MNTAEVSPAVLPWGGSSVFRNSSRSTVARKERFSSFLNFPLDRKHPPKEFHNQSHRHLFLASMSPFISLLCSTFELHTYTHLFYIPWASLSVILLRSFTLSCLPLILIRSEIQLLYIFTSHICLPYLTFHSFSSSEIDKAR